MSNFKPVLSSSSSASTATSASAAAPLAMADPRQKTWIPLLEQDGSYQRFQKLFSKRMVHLRHYISGRDAEGNPCGLSNKFSYVPTEVRVGGSAATWLFTGELEPKFDVDIRFHTNWEFRASALKVMAWIQQGLVGQFKGFLPQIEHHINTSRFINGEIHHPDVELASDVTFGAEADDDGICSLDSIRFILQVYEDGVPKAVEAFMTKNRYAVGRSLDLIKQRRYLLSVENVEKDTILRIAFYELKGFRRADPWKGEDSHEAVNEAIWQVFIRDYEFNLPQFQNKALKFIEKKFKGDLAGLDQYLKLIENSLDRVKDESVVKNKPRILEVVEALRKQFLWPASAPAPAPDPLPEPEPALLPPPEPPPPPPPKVKQEKLSPLDAFIKDFTVRNARDAQKQSESLRKLLSAKTPLSEQAQVRLEQIVDEIVTTLQRSGKLRSQEIYHLTSAFCRLVADQKSKAPSFPKVSEWSKWFLEQGQFKRAAELYHNRPQTCNLDSARFEADCGIYFKAPFPAFFIVAAVYVKKFENQKGCMEEICGFFDILYKAQSCTPAEVAKLVETVFPTLHPQQQIYLLQFSKTLWDFSSAVFFSIFAQFVCGLKPQELKLPQNTKFVLDGLNKLAGKPLVDPEHPEAFDQLKLIQAKLRSLAQEDSGIKAAYRQFLRELAKEAEGSGENVDLLMRQIPEITEILESLEDHKVFLQNKIITLQAAKEFVNYLGEENFDPKEKEFDSLMERQREIITVLNQAPPQKDLIPAPLLDRAEKRFFVLLKDKKHPLFVSRVDCYIYFMHLRLCMFNRPRNTAENLVQLRVYTERLFKEMDPYFHGRIIMEYLSDIVAILVTRKERIVFDEYLSAFCLGLLYKLPLAKQAEFHFRVLNEIFFFIRDKNDQFRDDDLIAMYDLLNHNSERPEFKDWQTLAAATIADSGKSDLDCYHAIGNHVAKLKKVKEELGHARTKRAADAAARPEEPAKPSLSLDALQATARLYFELGDYDQFTKASKKFYQAIKGTNRELELMTLLNIIWGLCNPQFTDKVAHFEEALQYATAALALDPGNLEAHSYLIRCHAKIADDERTKAGQSLSRPEKESHAKKWKRHAEKALLTYKAGLQKGLSDLHYFTYSDLGSVCYDSWPEAFYCFLRSFVLVMNMGLSEKDRKDFERSIQQCAVKIKDKKQKKLAERGVKALVTRNRDEFTQVLSGLAKILYPKIEIPQGPMRPLPARPVFQSDAEREQLNKDYQAIVEKAQVAFHAKDWDLYMRYLQETLILIEPTQHTEPKLYYSVLMKLGVMYLSNDYEKRDAKQARTFFEKAQAHLIRHARLTPNPEDAALIPCLIKCYEEIKNYEGIADLYDECMTETFHHILPYDSYSLVAEAYRQLNRDPLEIYMVLLYGLNTFLNSADAKTEGIRAVMVGNLRQVQPFVEVSEYINPTFKKLLDSAAKEVAMIANGDKSKFDETILVLFQGKLNQVRSSQKEAEAKHAPAEADEKKGDEIWRGAVERFYRDAEKALAAKNYSECLNLYEGIYQLVRNINSEESRIVLTKMASVHTTLQRYDRASECAAKAYRLAPIGSDEEAGLFQLMLVTLYGCSNYTKIIDECEVYLDREDELGYQSYELYSRALRRHTPKQDMPLAYYYAVKALRSCTAKEKVPLLVELIQEIHDELTIELGSYERGIVDQIREVVSAKDLSPLDRLLEAMERFIYTESSAPGPDTSAEDKKIQVLIREAGIYKDQKRYRDAYPKWKELIQILKTRPDLENTYLDILFSLGLSLITDPEYKEGVPRAKAEEAVVYLEEYYRVRPLDFDGFDALILAHSALDAHKKIVELHQRFLKTTPREPVSSWKIYTHLSDAYKQEKRLLEGFILDAKAINACSLDMKAPQAIPQETATEFNEMIDTFCNSIPPVEGDEHTWKRIQNLIKEAGLLRRGEKNAFGIALQVLEAPFKKKVPPAG